MYAYFYIVNGIYMYICSYECVYVYERMSYVMSIGQYLKQRQLKFLLHGQSGKLFWVNWSTEYNNNNPKFWVNTSKNKYIKENCAIMSTQVTYESNHIF